MLKIRYQADYQERDLWVICPESVLERKQQDKRQVELISSAFSRTVLSAQ